MLRPTNPIDRPLPPPSALHPGVDVDVSGAGPEHPVTGADMLIGRADQAGTDVVAVEEPLTAAGEPAAHADPSEAAKRRGVSRGRAADAGQLQGDPPAVDANAVVAYNIRAARRRNGWTQEFLAKRLNHLAGRSVNKVTISTWENAAARGRRHRFDALDLYVLARAPDVPLAYMFVPPPAELPAGVLAGTGESVCALFAAFLGHVRQLAALDERPCEVADVVAKSGPDVAMEIMAQLFGTRSDPDWAQRYHRWRSEAIQLLEREYGDPLIDAATTLRGVASRVAELSASAYFSQLAPDTENELEPP